MSLRDQQGKIGFGKRRGNLFVDQDGLYKNERKVKLLLILIIMDRIGRGLVDNGVTALQAFDATANERQKKAIAGGGQSAAPNSPREFVKSLAGKPLPVIRIAFQGKFGRPPTEEELI